jgi:hypothetical protein
MDEVECPRCKTRNSIKEGFCVECGRPIQDVIAQKKKELQQELEQKGKV